MLSKAQKDQGLQGGKDMLLVYLKTMYYDELRQNYSTNESCMAAKGFYKTVYSYIYDTRQS